MSRSVVLYGSEMAGVRQLSGVLFSMIVRWQVSGMCQECCSLCSEMSAVRHVSGVLFYDSEVTCDRQVSGVLFSMIVSWHVPGM